MLISQIIQSSQDHPLGANLRTGIGKVRISMQHIHILILGRQNQCHGYLPMLIRINIHHGIGIFQGYIIHLILNHLIKIVQLQEDQHLMNNYITKTVSLKRNRPGAHGGRRRWSSKSTK